MTQQRPVEHQGLSILPLHTLHPDRREQGGILPIGEQLRIGLPSLDPDELSTPRIENIDDKRILSNGCQVGSPRIRIDEKLLEMIQILLPLMLESRRDIFEILAIAGADKVLNEMIGLENSHQPQGCHENARDQDRDHDGRDQPDGNPSQVALK